MSLKNNIEVLSKELDLPQDVVEYAYKSFFSYIRKTITDLPLKEDLTEEEFSKLRTNFNLPSLGKLHCSFERYLKKKKQQRYIYENKRD